MIFENPSLLSFLPVSAGDGGQTNGSSVDCKLAFSSKDREISKNNHTGRGNYTVRKPRITPADLGRI